MENGNNNSLDDNEKAQEIKDKKEIDAFEPAHNTKRMLLAMRQQPRQIGGGVPLPGLFSDEEVLASDNLWFIVAIILEAAGLCFLTYALWEETSFSITQLIGIAVVVLGVDLTFACIHHWSVRPLVCRIENEKMRITSSLRNFEKDTPYHNYINFDTFKIPLKLKIWHIIAGFLIIFVGFAKAIVFTIHLPQIWNEQLKFLILIPCIISYGVVSYIHLSKTGYYIAYKIYKYMYKRNFDSYHDRSNPENIERRKSLTKTPDQVKIDLRLLVKEIKETKYAKWTQLLSRDDVTLEKEIKHGLETNMGDLKKIIDPHQIVEIGKNENDDKIYEIRILGSLTDSELENMVKVQPQGVAQVAVALYGHYLQCKYIAFK